MKIVLIAFYDFRNHPIRILHKTLYNKKIEVHTIFLKDTYQKNKLEYPTEQEFNLLISKIKELNPNFVGISLMSHYFQLSKKITKLIKENTNAKVIWGGFHPTTNPEECIKEADYICVGEAEEALPDLIQKRTDSILNIWVNKNGKIIRNKLRKFTDPNKQEFADWTDKNKYYIEDNTIKTELKKIEVAYIMGARGCPYSCTYCGNNSLRNAQKECGNYIRRRSVDNVIKELQELKENYDIKIVDIRDDVFLMDRKWVLEFAEKYKKHINIPFYINIHPLFCDEEILTKLKEANLERVFVGIQSGSEKIRQGLYKRFMSNKMLIDVSKMLKRWGINVTYHLIVDNPFETKQNKEETLNLLLKLRKPFDLIIFSLIYFPNTELTNLALEKGFIKHDDLEQYSNKMHTNWRFNKDKGKDYERFYNSLYILASTITPNWFIKMLSESKFLKTHPNYLKKIMLLEKLRILNYVVPFLKRKLKIVC
ncbi:MAG: B12-binding domain-containing radical SAM protein [Nanoarchaeota archaeon]|nr:B12-binding domain-containing radical SAM protein [Nanoarchaeota archaeon]